MAQLVASDEDAARGRPHWIESSLQLTAGRDPLGLQTITIDRIMPRLVPGILGLSRRARYFSFYPFLLMEYRKHRMAASNDALSTFVKAREYEFALAVQLCPRGCGNQASGVVGKQRAAPAASAAGDALSRGESVESYLGGYGLYYKTPLIEMGLVAPAGTPLGEGTTPVDVLQRNDRAETLATRFRDAVADTEYYRRHMRGVEPIPTIVLKELAEQACLCRLSAPEFQSEQCAIREALFSPPTEQVAAQVEQRRRSFGLFLSLLDEEPMVAGSDPAFRRAIWATFEQSRHEGTVRAATAAQWAALVAKDVMQEGLSSIWAETCHLGRAQQPPDGFSPNEVTRLIREELVGQGPPLRVFDGEVGRDGTRRTTVFADEVARVAEGRSLEELRIWAAEDNTALAGLALLLVLYRRLPTQGTLTDWVEIGAQRSEWQPGLLRLGQQLAEHLGAEPTVSDTMAWLVWRHVLATHERIAYSKLPNFTFRFRWEEGRLRFYTVGEGRFELTDIRHDSMARISEDVGFWWRDGAGAALTEVGRDFVREVFG